MNFIREAALAEVLVAWGRHEYAGRCRRTDALSDLQAIDFILRARSPLIGLLLLAQPSKCSIVELSLSDLPLLHALEHPLGPYAKDMLDAKSEDGEHNRQLTAARTFGGPKVSTMQQGASDVFIIDGLHRATAWVGVNDPSTTIEMALVETHHPSQWALIATSSPYASSSSIGSAREGLPSGSRP